MLNDLVVASNLSILDALKVIDRNAKGIVFALEQDKVIGLVTDGDIRRAMIQGISLDCSIEKICNKNFVKLNYSSDAETIQSTLCEKIKIIPLVDDNDKLVDFASIYRLKQTPVLEPFLGGNELEYVTDCVKTNWVSSQGKYVTQFENEIAKYAGAEYVLAVSNGTVALHLALVALGITKGDEVIVPDLTFGATLNAVILAGATPVIVDVDRNNWNINPSLIEKSITANTRAIMPVHIYGVPCDMKAITSIAKKHDLLVVEDCAEALGTALNNQHVGTFGDAGTFSFFGNKVITCGEGGAVIFRDEETFNKAKVLRDHGMKPGKRYWHDVVGFNYRLTNLQAAVGCAQLEQLVSFRANRKNIFDWYDKYLLSSGFFAKQVVNESETISYWLYTVLLNDDLNIDRDSLIDKLAKVGIDTRPVFYPMSDMPAFTSYQAYLDGTCAALSKQGISLPTSVYLRESEVKEISKIIINTVNSTLMNAELDHEK